MRTTKYSLFTLKHIKSESDSISSQLMKKSGMIRKLSSGIYTWLPIGLRVLHKVINIIKKEMNDINGIEILMPNIHPFKLWEKSKRIDLYGNELIKINDRKNRKFILAPTHEEAITYLLKNEFTSYKQLPIFLYQINNKYRDELRPCFGVIRAKEFIMKDGYSFHIDKKSMKKTYNLIYNKYIDIMNILSIKFKIIKAKNNHMGGNISHEFQTFCNNRYYNKNKIDFCNEKLNIFIKKNKISYKNIVQMIVFKNKKKFLGVLIRGDHKINKNKLLKIKSIDKNIKVAKLKETLKIQKYNLKKINEKILLIADKKMKNMSNFIFFSNIHKNFIINMNWNKKFPLPKLKNISNIKKNSKKEKNIEVAHIFQIEKKYSKCMNFNIKNNLGQKKLIHMGCYGIGVSRLVAAFIEQNHDEKGIIWKNNIAPFIISIIPININKSYKVRKTSEYIYNEVKKNNIDVIFYDSKERIGVMFNNIRLIGVPHLLVIREKNVKNKEIEYQNRLNTVNKIVKIEKINFFLKKILNI
ncbi:aminoacyl--tRNA ligase-related protein [Buchnera aphidicola (Taiwanaphis decaspermi)]|uniref:aminoacyl--tRNA ligase-related protein n=1 Tax=Buchnera aphidicola TaxID=9 RepID=UPI0031B80DE6